MRITNALDKRLVSAPALIWSLLLAGPAFAADDEQPPTVETERLAIRAFVADDWRDVQALAIDKESSPGAQYDELWPFTDEDTQELASYYADRPRQYHAVVLRQTGQVIGLIAFNGILDKRLDVGHTFHTTYQNDDIDREALREMITYAFWSEDIDAVVTMNRSEWVTQVTPLKSLGLESRSEVSGQLEITRAEWIARFPETAAKLAEPDDY